MQPPHSSVLLLNVVAHKCSGPPRLQLHLTDPPSAKRRPQCHIPSALFQKDAPEMTDAGYSACTVSSTKGPKEERLCKTKGCRKKGEMAGLESISGPVRIYLI